VALPEGMALTGHRSVSSFLRYFHAVAVQRLRAAGLLSDPGPVASTRPPGLTRARDSDSIPCGRIKRVDALEEVRRCCRRLSHSVPGRCMPPRGLLTTFDTPSGNEFGVDPREQTRRETLARSGVMGPLTTLAQH
jgi:hypothetical protein